MTQEEFEHLICTLREQAHAWLGNEANEKLERLIAHTEHLRSLLISRKDRVHSE